MDPVKSCVNIGNSHTPIEKPIEHIERIANKLVPFANKIATPQGQQLSFTQNENRAIYLLHKGSVALHRTSDSMVLNSESAPFVFGLTNQQSISDYLFLRPQETSEMSTMSLKDANTIIAHYDLWESLSRVLIYMVARVYDHCAKISQLSSYEVIRLQLVELMNESEKIRMNITAANYIQSRTFLSRSGTMRILSELKAGGYITLEKGVLINVNHLPLKY